MIRRAYNAAVFRSAWRSWHGAKGVALLAATALAIGIGATTAIYSVVNALMLKPLPYRGSDRFVALFSAATNDPIHYGTLLFRDAQTYQERSRVFEAFGWFRNASKNLIFNGEPHNVSGIAIMMPFAHQLGVTPAMGQWFQDQTGVVMSSALWRRLGADPAIVGKPITLDGRPYTVTGVMPESFRLPVAGIISAGDRAELWMPLDPSGRDEPGEGYFAYGRLKPGIAFAAADEDVKRVAAEIAAEHPLTHQAYTSRLYDLRETVIKDIRPTLLLLFAAAGLLFLITCANAAGLLLARAVARARETAMRVALGARRTQLAAMYFAEGLPVALAGAVGGVLVSLTLTPAIVAMAADYLPRADEVTVDWTVLLFALGIAIVATALCSLAPLWQATRTAPAEVLNEGARGSAGARSRRLSQSLVVAEIALAFALLAASAVLIVHLRTLARVSPGFDPEGVLTFILSLPGTIGADDDLRAATQRRLVDAIDALPGVDDVAFANQTPVDGCCQGGTIYPESRPIDLTASQRTSFMLVTPEYLRTMRIPLLHGRTLTERDIAKDLIYVMINQAAVRRYWGDQDPLDAYGRFNSPKGTRFQVIGIVGDIRNDGLGAPTVPEVYFLSSFLRVETMNFVVRSTRPPSSLLPDIRQAVRRIDPELPIHEVATFAEIIAGTLTLQRVAALMTSLFAGAALLLATLGVYGVIAYFVRQRTVEIGTRMAVGASSRDVLSLIIGGGLKMAMLGVIIGGVVAIAAVTYLSRQFEIGELGVMPFVASAAIVAAVAFTSSALPAWRAAALSPMVAIRNQPESAWQAARQTLRRAMKDFSARDEQPAVTLGTMLDDFANAVRRAESFPEAVQDALAALRDRIGAQSIALLDKSGQEYRDQHTSLPANGILVGRLRHYAHPLSLGRDDLDAWRRWAIEFKPDRVNEIEVLSATGAALALPLRTRTEIIGVLLLGPPAGRDTYTLAERLLLGSSANVFAMLIENARLNARAMEQERVRRDLALAAEVQRQLLPATPPRSPVATLSAFSLPARTVGGDYYDFVDLPGERIGIAIADVAGKGIAAALLMSVVQGSLRVIAAEGDMCPSQLATRMNQFLYPSASGTNKYATFFYVQLDSSGRRLRYVNAGHNPPYLVRRTATGVEVMELGEGGMVIGLFPMARYEDAELDVCPGDLFVAFTDGVPEAQNAAGEEFGEERLKDMLRIAVGSTANEVSATLQRTLRDWIAGAEQYDDLTVVVVAVNDPLSSGARA